MKKFEWIMLIVAILSLAFSVMHWIETKRLKEAQQKANEAGSQYGERPDPTP